MPEQAVKVSMSQSTPDYATRLEAAYGPPSQAAFSSAVFHSPSTGADDLTRMALATYRHFVGALWTRYGEEAWMTPWREVYTRPAAAEHDIFLMD
jgi:hypothetical protein